MHTCTYEKANLPYSYSLAETTRKFFCNAIIVIMYLHYTFRSLFFPFLAYMYLFELRSLSLSPTQSTNSTRYQHLIEKLFSTDAPQLTPWSFYLEPSDNKRDRPKRVQLHCIYARMILCVCVHSLPPSTPFPSLHTQNKFSLAYTLLEQMVCTKLAAIFTRHGE